MTGTDLVPVIDAPETYLAIQQDPQMLAQTIEANLSGEQLGAFDLDRIRVPTGGALKWTVPGLEGESLESVVTGVIVANRLTRSYWKESDPDNSPPDCSSPDAVLGFGDPGDALRNLGKGCADCPMAQWGSKDADDDAENGQACKQNRQLFLIDEKTMLPKVLVLPPTSLKPAKQFLQQLTSYAKPFWAVVVEIGLEGDTSAGGQKYAKATFRVVKQLDAELAQKIRAYADALDPVINQVRTYDAEANGSGGAVFNPDEQ